MNILQIIQSVTSEIGQPRPTTIVGNTSPTVQQYLDLLYATGRELRQARWWPQLKKPFTIYLVPGRTYYQLPQDFYASLPKTQWDQGNKWEMLGPMTDREWDYRLYGYITIENRKAYRVFGPDFNPNSGRGQFAVNPTPDSSIGGTPLTFEYITKSWLFPPNWQPGVSFGANVYVNANGNIYQKGSGSSNSGSNDPNMAYGQGQDGGVFWTAIVVNAWVSSTAYSVGDYVTNGGNLYYCSNQGISASSGGPSGTANSVTDGSVTWMYKVVGSWAAETQFAFGATIKISAQYYTCSTPGVQGNNAQYTGKVAPTWNLTTVSDGNTTWTYIPTAYETALTDSDLCLFDDDIMISGLKWRWLKSKGLEWQSTKDEYTQMVDTAMSRFQSGRKISLADDGIMLAGLRPNIPEGNYGG